MASHVLLILDQMVLVTMLRWFTNGIEYGDEELIDESYNIMRNVLKMPVDDIAKTFAEWNKGELSSYLVDITADILTRKDDLW